MSVRERALFGRHARGDRQARDELVERFLPLAKTLARRYERPGEPLEDLLQVAALALVKAIDRYDADRGCAFTSYAVPTIIGELKRHRRNQRWSVRPPTCRSSRCASRPPSRGWSSSTTARRPSASWAPRSTDATRRSSTPSRRARRAARYLRMRASSHTEPLKLQDILGATDDGYEHAEARALLDQLLGCLPPRSRRMLALRFEHDLTRVEIGTLIGSARCRSRGSSADRSTTHATSPSNTSACSPSAYEPSPSGRRARPPAPGRSPSPRLGGRERAGTRAAPAGPRRAAARARRPAARG